jgi:flagellar biosynthesis protein FlhA
VLHNLLREQVPVRDFLAIVETLGDWAPVTKDPDILTEHVRQGLARTLTKINLDPDGTITVVTLGPAVESLLAETLQRPEHGRAAALDPAMVNRMMHSLARQIEKCTAANVQPLVACSAQVRLTFKRMVDRFLPSVRVLSYEEILSNVEIRSFGSVELTDAD